MKKYNRLFEAYQVNEAKSYKLGDMYSKNFDFKGMLKMGMKSKISDGVEKLEKLHNSYEDMNYSKQSVPLWSAIVYLKSFADGVDKKAMKFQFDYTNKLYGIKIDNKKDAFKKAEELLKDFNKMSKEELGNESK